MDTILETTDKRQRESSHLSDAAFASQTQARIEQGENVPVWLHGSNYKAYAVRFRRGDLLVSTCDGEFLASQSSFDDVRLTAAYWAPDPLPAVAPERQRDLPALLMRLDANKVSLRRTYPGIALFPVTRISPPMREAVERYQSDLWRIAAWWGIQTYIRDAPIVFQ